MSSESAPGFLRPSLSLSLALALSLLLGPVGPAHGAPSAASAALEACRAELQTRDGAERRPDCLLRLYRAGSAEWPAPTVDAGVRWQELGPRRPLPPQPPERVQLGERLFFDPQLSRSGQISCASCHAPHLGFGDGRRLAIGHEGKVGPRHTPHLLGVAHVPALMWDGRAADLESQALLPIVNPLEMASELPALLRRLNAGPAAGQKVAPGAASDYARQFQQVFGEAEPSLKNLAAALASYQRTLEAPRSRFDEFIEGRGDALSTQELRGLHLFRGRARCMNCHSGPDFTQHEFHQIGMSFLGLRLEDRGRQAHSGRAEDLGSMRTPSLRGIARTAPYMHQGLLANLAGVIALYNSGMPQPPKREPPLPPPSPLIKPLQLNAQEMADLEAFLKTL